MVRSEGPSVGIDSDFFFLARYGLVLSEKIVGSALESLVQPAPCFKVPPPPLNNLSFGELLIYLGVKHIQRSNTAVYATKSVWDAQKSECFLFEMKLIRYSGKHFCSETYPCTTDLEIKPPPYKNPRVLKTD